MGDFRYSIFTDYGDKLKERDELERQLEQVKKDIREMEPSVATAMEQIGASNVNVEGYNLGFKTYRSVKYTGDVPRSEIADWLKRHEETAYLVEEKFNLTQVSAHYRRDEEVESRENLPPGLQWSEATVLHSTKSNRKT